MSILLLSGDLVITSWVRGAAERGGQALEIASSAEALLAKAQVASPRVVILDVGRAGSELNELVGRLKALAAAPAVIAFGPHVHEGRLAAATAAGCDRVVSRGQFHAQIDEILARYIAN